MITNTNNNQNVKVVGEKVAQDFALLINTTYGGKPVIAVAKVMEKHYVLADNSESFEQFDGNLYHVQDGRVVGNGTRWYWGLDRKFASAKHPFGELYREGRTATNPWLPKVYLTLRGRVPFIPYDVAAAIQAAYKTGKGVLTPEQIAKLWGKTLKSIARTAMPKQTVVQAAPVPQAPAVKAEPPVQPVAEPVVQAPVPAPAQKVELPVVTPEDTAAVEEDLAMLDKETKSPLERLQAGDPSILMELGVSQTRASKWAQQIREGSVVVKSIEDVASIKGVGPHMAEKLVKAFHEKFDA